MDDDSGELPPWAGPVGPRWADQAERDRRRRGDTSPGDPGPEPPAPPGRRSRGRQAAARTRRLQRSVRFWAGLLVVAIVIAAGTVYLLTRQSKPQATAGNIVTSFLPGEFRSVPNACSSVTPATLGQYLPGQRKIVIPASLYGHLQSLCNWTVDAPPRYRVLQVTVQAYAPSGLAPGNGSATFAAKAAYAQAQQAKITPPKGTRLPKATVSQVTGLGQGAFAALQVPRTAADPTDMLTVVARDHNVLVTVLFEGPAHAGGRYTPVQVAELRAGAIAAAHDILSKLH